MQGIFMKKKLLGCAPCKKQQTAKILKTACKYVTDKNCAKADVNVTQ
jgi:hypothetical protein